MKFFKSLNLNDYLIHCYGVTQESNTQNYALVLPFMENGSLRSYLNQNFNSLTWFQKFNILQNISFGLYNIHIKNLTHKDLHLGNILQSENIFTYISDFGFCKPADEIAAWRLKYYVERNIIIINEIISIIPPFNNEPHDYYLALDICRGKRPKIREETPEKLKELIQKCWDANPENRPTYKEITKKLYRAKDEIDEFEELSDNSVEESIDITNPFFKNTIRNTFQSNLYQ